MENSVTTVLGSAGHGHTDMNARNPTGMETVTACDLCGGRGFELFTLLHGAFSGRTFGIQRCKSCRLMFVSPRLTAEENLRLYSQDYFEGRGFDWSVNYALLERTAVERRRESLGIIAKIRAVRPGNDLSVLDVGCGLGDLLIELRRAGYRDVTGVELSEHAARVAHERSGAPTHVGELSNLDARKQSFDVINATEVLEHVRSPAAFLQNVAQLLKPGGIFVYSTGNADGLYARILGRRWPYLVPEGHLFYYTPSTLQRYYERVGLSTLDVRTLPRAKRRAVMRAEDEIAGAQLRYVGQSSKGIKGAIFSIAGKFSYAHAARLVTLAVGKYALPIGVKPKG
jgi:2-polyprenyl-3-methyl-5-hydroxy-6-metoxy-1,4-benzoquinol methylase